MLALPGSAYLYQGEELGLEEVDVAPEHRQDPSWFRTGEVGRDGCRVPIPWAGDRAAVRLRAGQRSAVDPAARRLGGAHGRGPGAGDPDSTLAFYRRALAARREHAARRRRRASRSEADGDVLTLRRGALTVVLNAGPTPVPMPAGRGPDRERRRVDGLLPPDTAVWLRLTARDGYWLRASL